jgi:hypothetical protein
MFTELLTGLFQQFQYQDPAHFSFEGLAEQDGVTAPYVRRVFRFALLSPNVVEEVLTGGVGNMSFATGGNGIPADWVGQRKIINKQSSKRTSSDEHKRLRSESY